MMVFGEAFQEDPEFQEGQVEFTCICTFKGEGPDGGLASLEACSDPERGCYCEFWAAAGLKTRARGGLFHRFALALRARAD
jgi:hypothetical protein